MRRETLEEARSLKEQAAELREVSAGALADQIAEVLMARMMRAYRDWDGNLHSRSGKELMMLRGLCREAGEMRRGSHSAARLQIKREQLELEQRKQRDFMKAEFDRWLETPEARERKLTLEENRKRQAERLREIFQ